MRALDNNGEQIERCKSPHKIVEAEGVETHDALTFTCPILVIVGLVLVDKDSTEFIVRREYQRCVDCRHHGGYYDHWRLYLPKAAMGDPIIVSFLLYHWSDRPLLRFRRTLHFGRNFQLNTYVLGLFRCLARLFFCPGSQP